MKSIRSYVFAVALATLPSSLLAAEGRSSDNPMLSEARAAFAEGRAQMAEGRYREAITKFRQAAQVKETPGLRYYIAYCLEQLDELIEAKAEYERAAELLKDFEAGDVRELLPEARARVDRSLASLQIDGLSSGDQAFIDGNAVRQGVPIFLNPGSHEVVVRASGGQSSIASIQLGRGETRKFIPEAPPRVPSAVPAREMETPQAVEADSSPKVILFWTSLGVAALGAGTLATGLILREDYAIQANQIRTELIESEGTSSPCSSNASRPPQCADLASAVNSTQTFETVAIAGGVGLGVGVTSALLIHFLWPNAAQKVEVNLSPQSFALTLRTSF